MKVGYVDNGPAEAPANAPVKVLTAAERAEIQQAVEAIRPGHSGSQKQSRPARRAQLQRFLRLAVRHAVPPNTLFSVVSGAQYEGVGKAQRYGLEALHQRACAAGKGRSGAFRAAWGSEPAVKERLNTLLSPPAKACTVTPRQPASEPLYIEIKRGNNHARFTITTDNDVTLAAQVMRGWI